MPATVAANRRASSKKHDGQPPVNGAPGRQRSSSQRPRADSHRATPSPSTAAQTKEDAVNASRGAQQGSRGSSSRPTEPKKTTPANTQRPGKGRVGPATQREVGEASVTAFASTDPARKGTSTLLGANGSATASSSPLASSFFSSQVHPSGPKAATRRRSTTSRIARGVLTMVAVSRLQRATRLFLLRRALRHIPPSADRHSSIEEHTQMLHDSVNMGDAEDVERRRANVVLVLEVPASPPATESRMLHRIRAELHRNARLRDLRITIARRTLDAALRGWVQRCRARRRRHRMHFDASDGALQSTPWALDEEAAVRVEEAACTVQAMLRVRHSLGAVARRGVQEQQRAAAVAIQHAWRRSPLRRACVARLHDHHARELLCRQEALERRDVHRRHLLFLVRSHQQLYNHPCMWEAGLAVRRLPLYTADGLHLTDPAESLPAGPKQLRAAAEEKEAGGSTPHATMPALLGFTSSPFSTVAPSAANVAGGTRDDLPYQDAWWECLDDALDVDAAQRHCQYRLFFSPEERRLLEEAEASAAPVPGHSVEASQTQTSTKALAPPRSPDSESDVPSSAKAFASALTYLRQPRTIDPTMQRVLKRLEKIRSDPCELYRVLCTHGYLPLELVAPLMCYGLHYQKVARGEEDQAVLSSTAVMQLCEPLVVSVAASPAAELRNCLVGAAVRGLDGGGSGGSSNSGSSSSAPRRLPLPLEESRCRREAALREHRVGIAGPREGGAALQTPAPATLQRGGFANPATQALFQSGVLGGAGEEEATVTADGAARTGHRNAGGGDQPAEWDHRLAAGVGEVGATWRQFLLSIPVSPPSSLRPSATALSKTKPTETTVRHGGGSAAPPSETAPPARRFVGLCSHLAPASSPSSAPSLLLQAFVPSPASCSTDHSGDGAAPSVLPDQHLTPNSSAPVAVPPSTVLRMEEWWDAVERLLIQERVRRRAAEHNESEQRRSVCFLRRLAPLAAAAPTTATSLAG